MGWLRKTPLEEQQQEQLYCLARSSKRSHADRARAILMTYQGQTAEQIADVLIVRAQSVRRWRIRFARQGVEGLKDKPRSGRPPLKREAALSVVPEKLQSVNQSLTCPRLVQDVQKQTGVTLTANYMSLILKKGVGPTGDLATASIIDRINKP